MNSNKRRRNEKQKKEKEKKKEASLWPRPARLHSPSSPTAPTGLPTTPAFTQRACSLACGPAHVAHAHASSARLPSLPPDPMRQPHVTHACVPLRFLLAVAATWPRMSATPVHSVVFSMPTPNRPRDRAPTAVAGRTRGSRPGHGPISLAPCSRNLTRAV